ncbi:MAG: CPBP family intramembrane metalloprotease [Rhodobacteraceae bacterium]|nr:CPBP family intramembrane metalloprotease [Paracoccaceae bacterium]
MVGPARAGCALRRTALGAALTAGPCTFAPVQLVGPPSGLEAAGDPHAQLYRTDAPSGALPALPTFALLAAGPLVSCRIPHFRRWQTPLGPPGQATWDTLLAARAVDILAVVLRLLLPGPDTLGQGAEAGRWLALLPLAAPAIPVQTGAEELVLRGCLQSQLAARFRSPLVWMVLPSALFARGHCVPGASGARTPWNAAPAFAFGLAAADLTARTGSLGAAMRFHFAHNAIAMAVIARPGAFAGLALFLLRFGPEQIAAAPPLPPTGLAAIGLSWLAIRVALRL